MSDKKNSPDQAALLRKRAEEQAREKAARMPENIESLPPEETQRLLHELRVHQIELEMQNDELRRAQDELESSRAQYFDLYDLAPVGYVSISEKGLIMQANLAAANLLGATRSYLSGKPFSAFVSGQDQDSHYLRLKQLLKTGEPQAYELRMLRGDGAMLWTQIEAAAALDSDGAFVCRAVLSDITDRKKAQASLARKELMFLSRKMILAQEEDRKRLARELHDSLGQKIISMQLEIEWLRKRDSAGSDNDVYKNMLKLTVEASDELQHICLGLRPLVLDRIGFNAAMKSMLEEFENTCDIAIESRIMTVDETRISPDTAINIYRILQEALTNIVRHSNAKSAFVSLHEEGSEIILDVKDEGCGLEEDKSARRYNFGILGMRERANMSGGRFEMDSSPGKGTRIKVSIPVGDKTMEIILAYLE